MREKIHILLLITSILLPCMISGCSSEDNTIEESSEIIVEEYNTEETEHTKEDNSEDAIEINEPQYPMLITPTLTKQIDFAIESEDIFCIYNGEKYGYMTKSGQEITDYIYDVAFPFSEGLACVNRNGKYGFIDMDGNETIPLIYEDVAPFQEGLAYFSTEKEYGFLEKDGTVAFYLECDSVSSFQEGLAYFSLDGKYGYIDKKGQIALEPAYSDADYFENGLAFVEIDGFKGAINANGEEIIPVEYDNIYRLNDYIVAELEDKTEYYTFSGDEFSPAESETGTGTDDEQQENIFLLEGNKNIDLSSILLKNAITPRIEQYWNLSHRNNADIIMDEQEEINLPNFSSWSRYDYIKQTKLYDLEQSEFPILYCKEVPIIDEMFPMSASALYAIKDDQVQCLVSGYECGGSLRGDYVCFWRDKESGEILIGYQGAAGGFGGFSNYSDIYGYQNGAASEKLSYVWIGQTTDNYSQEELLENASMFYDDNDVPYTKETIQETETVNEYLVNDERVSIDIYENICSKYQYFKLFK